MCCIFTCCGWMLDLIQRVWVFLMSCLISSAMCCVLISSSLSGVALGYNYSLAEYIDLKETNVSVFIKRGVFDDDVVDDMMDFRRKGAPLRTLKDDGDLKTATDEQEQVPDSRRRLDDSILESNDRNNFEGSLMKLTLKPLAPLSTEETTVPDDSALIPILTQPPPGGSLDQLKAIQGIINARKAAAPRNPMEVSADKDKDARRSGNSLNEMVDLLNIHNVPPDSPGSNLTNQFRRMMSMLNEPNVRRSGNTLNRYNNPLPDMPPIKIHPARLAVPSSQSEMGWNMPNVPPDEYRRMMESNENPPSRPGPLTYSTGPIRPPTTKIVTFATPTRSHDMGYTFGTTEVSNPDISPVPTPKIVGSENIDYYDDEVKGLPVRKRRHVQNYTETKNEGSEKEFFTERSTTKIVTSILSDFKSLSVETPKDVQSNLTATNTDISNSEVFNENVTTTIVTSVYSNVQDTPKKIDRQMINSIKTSNKNLVEISTIKIFTDFFSNFSSLFVRKLKGFQDRTNTTNEKLSNEISTEKSVSNIAFGISSNISHLITQKHEKNFTKTTNGESDEVFTEKSSIKIVTDILSSFKVGETVSNEITVPSSILVSKLHFLDKLVSDRTSPANEKAVTNGAEATKAVGVTANDTRTIRSLFCL